MQEAAKAQKGEKKELKTCVSSQQPQPLCHQGLPDSLPRSILGTHPGVEHVQNRPTSHSRSKQLVLTAHQYCCSRDVKDSSAIKELFYQFLS